MRNFELPGRSPVHSLNGMAATSHPLATLTAINVLNDGGNAVDAAVAACAAQCVVEPQSTGIGGDCFVLFAPKGSGNIIALNGSGRAPAAATVDWYAEQGITAIERTSPHAVTIPGAIDAWARLVKDYGTKSLDELLRPAIEFASGGYPVHSRVAFDWQLQKDVLHHDPTTSNIFLPGGRPLQVGKVHTQPLLAKTLKKIAEQGRDGFYTGPVAEDIVAYMQSLGGLHTLEDFANAQCEYVNPIMTAYRGYEVFECPPNGQGLTPLVMLNVLREMRLDKFAPLSVDRLHLEVEVARLAHQDRSTYIADPAMVAVPVDLLLSAGHASDLRSAITMEKAMKQLPTPDLPNHADTAYLCVVDRDRNGVSFINSLYSAFGSGLTSPTTGVLLQNRGVAFSLDFRHPNSIAPGKRPLHTIIPGMVLQEGRLMMPFGVMGGQYQATGHVHFLTNLLDFGLDVQEAIDLPRVFPRQDGVVEVESGVPGKVADSLRRRGHTIKPPVKPIGGAQAILIDWEKGVLTGGSDPRKDGCALGY